jgi:phosphatidylserine/phosphatidylglycerophosphate/cardiolipin synthase-like enzyme
LLERLDRNVGEGLDRLVVAHHRRRLRRLGHRLALEPPAGGWAAGDPPPRAGNDVEILVDGIEALPRIAEAISSARESVHLAGWHFEPSFQLDRRGVSLRELLAEAAERVDVRVLAWAGSPLPLFHPDRSEVRQAMDRLTAGTRVRLGLDARERPLHCHHEKIVVVDGELAFVGGIDLTAYGGDRHDARHHPTRGALGWHDAAAELRGPAVGDVAAHFALRWAEVTGEELEQVAPAPVGSHEVQVVRTTPERIYERLPRGDFRILESYLRALRSAERLIYLESQFLWSQELVDVLEEKLRRPPSDAFRLVTVLPARPNNGADDTRGQIAQLLEADGDAGRFLACALYQCGAPRPTPVYVHAKIGIVDDRWLTLGSANLNEHSLFNDTEMNVVVQDPELVRATRLRLWAEHLDRRDEELDGDATRIVDELWRPLAEEGEARLRRHEPLDHRIVRLPGVSRRSRRLLGPINGLVVDG